MEDRQLVCGDAYSFQGNERDVMFLSLVAAPNGAHVSALTANRYRQRFNVAASRARDQLWLFHSAKLEHLSSRKDCVRRSPVEFFTRRNDFEVALGNDLDVTRLRTLAAQSGERGVPPSPFDSWFEVDVYLNLVDRGYTVRPHFPVANYRIDLVVEGMKTRLAIECDGDMCHGPEEYASDVRRQRQLECAGWQFFRVRGSEYYVDPERALAPLWTTLQTLEITPESDSHSSPEVHGNYLQESRPLSDPRPSSGYSAEASLRQHTDRESLPPPPPGVTRSRLQDLFRWSRENLLLSVDDRIYLAEIEEKLGGDEDLTDEARTELFRIYDLAWQRGFRPGPPN